ncbi:hypothetical protein D9M69_653900 [compost metagenome]
MHEMAASGPMAGPKSSTAMTMVATGVWAVPANIATKPIAASIENGRCRSGAMTLPRVPPM